MSRISHKRRNFLAGLTGLGLNTALGSKAQARTATPDTQSKRTKRPNIIFIMADDLGYADVSCFGSPGFTTPAIDQLARGGIRLTRAYANSAVCSATRTALITGRYQDRLACGLEEPIAFNSTPLGVPPGLPTLPEQLRKGGYHTALVGKWHLGPPPGFGPLKSGYEHFYGISGGAADYFTHQARPGHDQFYNDSHLVHEHGYLTQLLGREAVRLVDVYSKEDRPFFMSLHFNAPHWPWEGPEDEAESRRLKGHIFDYDGGTQKTYGRMVQAMDTEIGRVLAALDKNGVAENTLVIFTSDNGGERYSAIWPFTGMKGELLEGGLRVPAIARWPGHIPAHSQSAQAIITMDWVPTLLAAAGITPDPTFPSDGENILPFLEGETTYKDRHFSWRYKRQAQQAQLEGDYKYLRIHGNEFLFNVVEDPRERANLKDRQPELFQKLKQDWQAWNAKMLPYTKESYSWSADGAHFADHYGVTDDLKD